MTQIHKKRSSRNPFIDRVWQSQNITDGIYLATPDNSWDLIMGVNSDGSRSMMIAGQATKPANVPYKAGTSSMVISFAAGVYMPHLSSESLLDTVEFLPITDDNHFSLAGYSFIFPTFDNAEELVDKMIEKGLLEKDDIVDGILGGKAKAVSKRAVQRHFIKTTGTTHKQLEQIRRAQDAVRLLQQGKKPIDAAVDAGYADQPHLAKSLKRIMSVKPSDVDDIHKL